MEERIKARISELQEEHAKLWQIFMSSELGRRLLSIEGGIEELKKLLPHEEALPSGE